MKRMILATSLVVGLMTCGSLMAMEPLMSVSPSADLRTAGNDTALQIGESPMLLASGDAWEMRSEPLQQPLSRKIDRPMRRQDVRETNPWWR
ncbi:hypothetical protein [Halomonas organivorans]|uniref:Secreted protein n=1 Tax=Halomonas organivorans TaxID=257772 RepID=A0A7W5BVP1_9GAMM|nr:hypothetical protein [Halomonas organivorans]MBB3139951.1 hypothetical protein [Halomonas organivorans]